MKNILFIMAIALLFASTSCKNKKQSSNNGSDAIFANFENKFLDSYWKQYPTASIMAGYGKYYENLVIPDSNAFAGNITFSKLWADSLNKLDYNQLSDNNKISFNILKNQLESDIWYQAVFKPQEWDATQYNLSAECDYIINQPYAPLDERLKILSRHLQHADEYYKAALSMLHQPTKEHLELSIIQNLGGLSVFGNTLTDSIKASHLTSAEKDALQQNINKTVAAMNGFVKELKAIDANKKYSFRDFRIGKKLYSEKFKYDLAIDFSPEQIYEKATADKQVYKHKMIEIASSLWSKYYPTQSKPADSLKLVQLILDKVQLQHASPQNFFSLLTSQVYQLKNFIIREAIIRF